MSRSNFEIEAGSNKRESYAVTVKRFGQSDETLEITVEFKNLAEGVPLKLLLPEALHLNLIT